MVNIEQVEVIYFIKTFNARGEFNGYLSEYDKETSTMRLESNVDDALDFESEEEALALIHELEQNSELNWLIEPGKRVIFNLD